MTTTASLLRVASIDNEQGYPRPAGNGIKAEFVTTLNTIVTTSKKTSVECYRTGDVS